MSKEMVKSLKHTRGQKRSSLMRAGFVFAILFVFALDMSPVAAQTGVGPRGARDLQESFRAVARNVKPAVVNVSAVGLATARNKGPEIDPFFRDHPLFREFFGDEFFKQFFNQPGGQRRQRLQGLGSGFIFDPRGYVVTNTHVIRGADEIQVILADKKKFKARVIAADPKTDVAVIKIDGQNLPYAKLGDSEALEVGDWVLAIGNPFGLMQTMTAGIVSAKGRSDMGILPHEDFIQTDAAINKGNSGGPLVNIDGLVVGMNTAIFSENGGNMGIGFAIPVNLIRRAVDHAMRAKPAGASRSARGPDIPQNERRSRVTPDEAIDRAFPHGPPSGRRVD